MEVHLHSPAESIFFDDAACHSQPTVWGNLQATFLLSRARQDKALAKVGVLFCLHDRSQSMDSSSQRLLNVQQRLPVQVRPIPVSPLNPYTLPQPSATHAASMVASSFLASRLLDSKAQSCAPQLQAGGASWHNQSTSLSPGCAVESMHFHDSV